MITPEEAKVIAEKAQAKNKEIEEKLIPIIASQKEREILAQIEECAKQGYRSLYVEFNDGDMIERKALWQAIKNLEKDWDITTHHANLYSIAW